ncbi:helix-turn-helix domain-containing protein [Pseudoalteromonas citrea]|uniref:helix-turn-helix domain-containing protein n=1 Tax=Pseudoalteromonas citrea TaxID=43655 RepID=UPI002355660A|nr:helix-turn-helix domain-containing protein [Pseudoalteromonas citrea]
MAKRLYVCERTLIRRFHKHVGLSPSAYVRLARLEKTKFLLRSTTDNFDIISAHVGYQDANALNKQFKAQYGTSMVQWRRIG